MTLVASWLCLEPGVVPTIWTAADSQISSQSDTLSLHGSKILELTLNCRNLTTPIQKVYYSASFGFAYAGSSFTAFNTYSTLAVILKSLGGSNGDVPSHTDIVTKCKEILKHYAIDKSKMAEISLFGFCPITKQPFIAAIKPSLVGDFAVEIKHGLTETLEWSLLGDNDAKNDFNNMMKVRLQHYSAFKTTAYWRSPFYPLRDIIQSGAYSCIGGNLQLSFTTLTKFEYISVVDVLDKNCQNSHTLTFRNFDLFEDIGLFMGRCIISITGMHMDAN